MHSEQKFLIYHEKTSSKTTLVSAWYTFPLPKPASFKKIPEDVQINKKADAKLDPTTIEKMIQTPCQNDTEKQ